MISLWTNARIAAMAPDAETVLLDGATLVTQGPQVRFVGAARDVPVALEQAAGARCDLGGALLTPGLIDCHTHLVYGGSRAREFEMRLQGASYEEIARAGGGIRSTVAATRAASDAELAAQSGARLAALLRDGVTAIEIKSGYGLSLADEGRLLRVARQLGAAHDVTVRTTYLGAHALPAEYAGRPDDYIAAACGWLGQLHAQGLVDAVDAFCDNVGFTPAQVARVFAAARSLGLPVKLHAEQLSNQHGAALAAGFGALSCDHLEHLDDAGVQAMVRSGTVAVLLPGAYYYLRETRLPPVAALRAARVPMAVSTDHNPGTSPVLSLQMMLNMACVLFGLTPWEALQGVTVHAARALGLDATHGRLVPGMRADFVVWDAADPSELAYFGGRNACRRVVRGGIERAIETVPPRVPRPAPQSAPQPTPQPAPLAAVPSASQPAR